MARELYSKRNKPVADVFLYDSLSKKLKTQIYYVWDNFFAQLSQNDNNKNFAYQIWETIEKYLREEYGIKSLADTSSAAPRAKVESFFEHNNDIDKCLDVVEQVFIYINHSSELYRRMFKGIELHYTYSPKHAIDTLNKRFLENATGFEFRNNEIIRIDNKLLHQEIIIPTLHFLSTSAFSNANEEYLKAHEHFRHGRTKECLNESLKALESTLKIICSLNDWTYDPAKATASTLIKIVLDNQLVPAFLQTQFSSLKTLLESGVPTLRNKLGGHGQGPEVIDVPMHYASYMLYLTGSTINFLVSCQQELKA